MGNEIERADIKEYLALNSESPMLRELEPEFTKGFDPKRVLLAHRAEMEDLVDILEDIEVINREFDPDRHALEAVERAYVGAIDLMLHQGRRFHPLSTYGRKRIYDAINLRDRYESMYAPLITGIDDTNVEYFLPLIPDDLIEEIYTEKLFGVGVFRTDRNVTMPVGVAVYRFIELPQEAEVDPIIDIRWIFVDEDYRGEKVADLLIGELVALLSEAKGSAITMSVPYDNEYMEAFLTILDEWRFAVSTGIDENFTMKLSDFNGNTIFDNYKPAKVLSSVSEEKRDGIIERFLSDNEEMLDFYDEMWEDYFDFDISCYTGSSMEPTGLLLAHVKPSGVVDIEFFEGVYERLLSSAIRVSYVKFGGDALLTAHPTTEEEEEFLDNFVSEQQINPTIDGVLMAPGAWMDVTEEDVDEIFSAVFSA